MTAPWCCVLTPGGTGGIAVVAVGGRGATAVLARCVARLPAAPGAVAVAVFQDAQGPLDQVLVARRAGTADEHFELHCHGGAALVAAVTARLAALGCVPGRAPVAPLRAEVDALLCAALSPAAAALALEQTTRGFLPWLLDLLAALRAGAPLPSPETCAAPLRQAGRGAAHFVPFTVALWGRKNAGKSSLLNRLLGVERALTGAEPGLTRDAVMETTVLAGYPVRLMDLPGLGPGGDALDAAALQRAEVLWRAAELGVLVVDAAVGMTPQERTLLAAPGRAWLVTRADCAAAWPASAVRPPTAPLVVVRGDRAELAPLVQRVFGQALQQLRGLPAAGPAGQPVPLSGPMVDLLRALQQALDRGDRSEAIALLARALDAPPAL